MIRSHRTRVCALVAATACAAAAMITTVGTNAGADDAGLVPAAEWHPFPADTVGHGHVAVDDAAGVGYVFSGTLDEVWSRVQAVDLRTGKPLSAVTPTRTLPSRSPVLVDVKRHVVVYAETYPRNHTGTFASHIVGIALRGKEVKEVFRVASPLGPYRIAGMAYDDSGNDLFVVGTADGAGVGGVDGSSLVQVQRVALDALLRNTLSARWSRPLELPPGVCPTPLQTNQPAGVLVVKDSVFMACRGSSNFVTGTNGQNLTGATGLILRMDGLGAASPAPAYTVFRTPGNFTISGESAADDRTRRFVTIESSGYVGLRVFDTDHSRFVGRVNAGAQSLYGLTFDRRTSRAYFISSDSTVGVGYGDLEPLEPTQGERVQNPYSGLIANGVHRRLSFDTATRRLFIPMRKLDEQGRQQEYVVVLRDTSDAYRAPERFDHAAGTIDAVDREGVTESSITTIGRAYGVDYQLIGGTANVIQNVSGSDSRGNGRPGTRHLRAAYVKSGSLTGDGALAYATSGEEDQTTDQDRHGVTAPSPAPSSATAGSRFAPVAECSDYGAGKTEATQPGASVLCDLKSETTRAKAAFQGDDAVLVTVPQSGQSNPVRIPVEVGKAWTEISEHRAPNRGALTTTITAVAESVTIAGVATLGRVAQTVVVTAHGRSGTAKASRTVTVSNVVVGGKDVCGAQCHPATVQREINRALDGRGGVEFPGAVVYQDPRGTYAEVTQDPWYHAERVSDYDKATDDYVVPVMSLQLWMDSTSKSRLVVDFAGVAGSASYRVFKADEYDGGDSGDGDGDGDGGGTVVDPPAPVATVSPSVAPVPKATATPPAPQVAQEDPGFLGGLAERLSLSLRSLRDALPLLLIWALLAVPAYLSARRRLLLELPMLTRDEELT